MTNDDAFMALAGVRYCLGRHSYAPGLCCDWLKVKWATFRDGDKAQIVREIRQHVVDHDTDGSHAGIAGWEMDLRTWESFLDWVPSPTSPGAQEDRSDA
nr:hypothetical protein NG677_04545 [Methylobacterium sp. OTU13CASTA1]